MSSSVFPLRAVSVSWLLAFCATGGCGGNVDGPESLTTPASVRINVFTVNEADVPREQARTQYRIDFDGPDCDGCGVDFDGVRVQAGPPEDLVNVPGNGADADFQVILDGFADEHLVRIDIDGRIIECLVTEPGFFDVVLSPSPTASGGPTTVTWSATTPSNYATVTVQNTTTAEITYQSGIGNDDGTEMLPASAFLEPGRYQLQVGRAPRQSTQGVNDAGDRYSCSGSVQVNMAIDVPGS